MRILALQTEPAGASIGIYEPGMCLFEAEPQHTLGPAGNVLAELLRPKADLLKTIDAFSVNIGPGSFTGLRVGVSFLKGLFEIYNKPIYAVSSLSLWAYLCHSQHPQYNAQIVVLDARGGHIYAQSFGIDESLELGAYTKKNLIEYLSQHRLADNQRKPKIKIAILGDIQSLQLRDDIQKAPLNYPKIECPKASDLARYVFEASNTFEILHDASQLKVQYLLGSPVAQKAKIV